MGDIQSATGEIRRRKKERYKERKKPQGKNIMSASGTMQGGHNNRIIFHHIALQILGYRRRFDTKRWHWDLVSFV